MGVTFNKIDTYIDLELPELLLRGGNYSVVIVVQKSKIGVHQIDLLHNVLSFSVFSGDYWSSGKINRATNVALINAKYKL